MEFYSKGVPPDKTEICQLPEEATQLALLLQWESLTITYYTYPISCPDACFMFIFVCLSAFLVVLFDEYWTNIFHYCMLSCVLGCMHHPAHPERLPSSNTIVNSTPGTSNTNVTQSEMGWTDKPPLRNHAYISR